MARKVGENGMHGSASPFEAMAERMNWLGETLEKDKFAKTLSAAGLPESVNFTEFKFGKFLQRT